MLGWVIEMWGYSVAAASIGLRHQEYRDFQVNNRLPFTPPIHTAHFNLTFCARTCLAAAVGFYT